MGVSMGELRGLVMDREAWRAAIYGITESRTRLSDWTELHWTHVYVIYKDSTDDTACRAAKETDVKNISLDSLEEGEGGMI